MGLAQTRVDPLALLLPLQDVNRFQVVTESDHSLMDSIFLPCYWKPRTHTPFLILSFPLNNVLWTVHE